MPIKLEIAQELGWDKNAKHGRNDPIFVMRFIDEKTKRVLFTYGAKFTDIETWVKYFAELGEYEKNKKVCGNTCLETTSDNDRGRETNCQKTN